MKLQLTIGRKIQLCMIAMILFTIISVVATTFPRFEESIADATKNHLMDQVTTEADTINGLVKEYSYTLKSNTLNSDFIALLTAQSTDQSLSMTALNDLCQSDKSICGAALLDNQGNVMASTAGADTFGVTYQTDNSITRVLEKEAEFALSGVVGAGSGQEAVMLAVPVRDAQNTTLGVLAGFISYEVFDNHIKQSSVTGIQNLAAYIMDKDGIIFGHTEANKVGTAVQNAVIQDVVERLKQGENIEKGGTSYQYKGSNKFAGYYVIPESHWIICMSVSEGEIIGPIRTVECKAYIISFILCIIACILTVILTNMIVKPIRVTNRVLNKVAGFCFQLDDSYRIYGKKKDETGEMCSSICTMVDSLREEISQINSVSEEMTATAHSLKKIATSVTKSSENNRALMDEMDASFNSIEQAAADIGQQIGNVHESAGEMNNIANKSMEKVQSLMERATQIKQKAAAADAESEHVFSGIRETMELALEQAQSVEKIGIFTDTIMSISRKTKLLSLNATIEAANAGEHGKGFAVVAGEIGNLAAQSATSADSIGELVTEIYQAVNGLKECLEQSLSYIEEHVVPDYRNFSEASEGYSHDAAMMIESMNFLKNEISKFSDAMSKSVEAVEQIQENITSSAEQMHSMSDENASVSDQIQETYEMVKTNSSLSKNLKQIVEKYTL